MAGVEETALARYLRAFGVERQEAGLGFQGFGEEMTAEEIAELEERAKDAPAGRRELLARLLWRAARRSEGRDRDPSIAAAEVLGALVLAEVHRGGEHEAVLARIPSHLEATLARTQGSALSPEAASFGLQAASLAAGLLLARGAKPERAREGDPLALSFMACEGFVRGLDALEKAPEEPMGPHPYADLLRIETGAPLIPKDIAEAALTALGAEMREARSLARQIAPGEDLEAVVAGISEDAPGNPAELLEAYRGAYEEVGGLRGDFPEPSAPLEIALAPAQLHGLLPLTAYLPPSAEDPAGTVLVSEALGPMRGAHARARTVLAMAHDGLIGSHLAFCAAREDLLRRLLLSPFTAQGWALYAARYAAGRLGSEKVALVAALDGAQRAARAFADAALHARIAPREQILRALSEALSLPDALAEAELRAAWRQPGSGALPWWIAGEIESRVRSAVERGIAPREAHRAVLAAGALPPLEAVT